MGSRANTPRLRCSAAVTRRSLPRRRRERTCRACRRTAERVALRARLTTCTRDAMILAVLNGIRSGRVQRTHRLQLGFALLACVVGVLIAAGTAPAAQSNAPAACHVTPCLLIGRAGGDTYVFTAWESEKSPKIPSIDLTVFLSARPTDVRSSGRCAAPVGPGRYSLTVSYFNITCTLSPAGRAIQVCFNDSASLENHANTAEFPPGRGHPSVRRAEGAGGCPVPVKKTA